MNLTCKSYCFAIIFGIIFENVNTANILFFFVGANLSHKLSSWPFARELANVGHNVTFVSSHKKQFGGGEKIHDIVPETLLQFTSKTYELDRIKERIAGTHWDYLITTEYEEFMLSYGCPAIFASLDEELRKTIYDTKYDLVVLNNCMNDCTYYIINELGTKYISYSSSTLYPWTQRSGGAPIEASSVPEINARFGSLLNLRDRMLNFYYYWITYDWKPFFSKGIKEMYANWRNIDPSTLPNLEELERNASLIFINSHFSTGFARSLPPNYIEVGGMQCFEEIGQLPKEVKKYMDEAEDGVVLITFGSTIDLATLDSYYINAFYKMMTKFSKVRFIWRWKGPLRSNQPKNLMNLDWVPQREILNHPKTIAFMTHGGTNSVNEATFYGIPLIILPLFADQDFSAYRIEAQELGRKIEVREFSQDILDSTFKDVLTNKNYKANMKIRSKMFKDRPLPPAKEAVWWTEFVLRQEHTKPLKPMFLDQPFIVRTSIDVFLSFLFLLIILPLLTMLLIFKIYKLIFN